MINIIKIHLRDNDDYKNLYNDNILAYSLSNYLLEETKGISSKNKLKFIITSDFEIKDEEKNKLISMIRNNFGADISEIINLSKKQQMTNFLILFIGILFLLIYYLLLKVIFLSEFTLILGWVFIGESICNFLYNGIENKSKIARRKQIVDAKVEFENISQQKSIG